PGGWRGDQRAHADRRRHQDLDSRSPASRDHASDRPQLEAGPRRRRPNSAPTTRPPNPTSAIAPQGMVLPDGGPAAPPGTVLLTSLAPSDAVPRRVTRGPHPVAVMLVV